MFAAIARKHLRLMLALAGLALAAGAAVWHFSRPVFYSRSLVRVDAAAGGDRVRALAKELTQPQILERTAGRLGVKATATDIRENFLFNTAARAVSDREIEVEAWCFSKDWAQRWTEALVAEFVDFRRIRRRKETLDAIKTLNKEMTEIAAKFAESGAGKFYATDKQGLLMGLDELTRLRNLTRDLARLGNRIEEMDRVRTDLQNANISLVEKLSLIAAVDESAAREGGDATKPVVAAWESMEKRRRMLESLIAGIPNNSAGDDALLLVLNGHIWEIERKLQAEFDAGFRRFDVDYRNVVDQKAALETKVAERNGPGGAAMTERFQHLAERIQAIDAVPPDDAITPVFAGIRKIGNRPVAPDPVKIALWSLLGGGVLALVAPFFAERLGHGQSKLARLESTLQLPGLGVIPARADLLPPFFEAGEIFHEMRAKLPADKAPRVLMVASAMPGEGKTTVAVNLAMSFAESGARTLVIDTDIRRGRLNRIFGFRKAPGLSNVLLGETPLEDAVRPTFIENLSVMNAGTPASAAPDLLASDAFATSMAALRESYDIIVLDTPPVLGLAETSVLQKHVDGVLLVVADNRTPKNSIQAAIEILRERGANMVGFVVNRVKPADQSV